MNLILITFFKIIIINKLNNTMKKVLSIIIFVILANFISAQVSMTINVQTAGKLNTLLTAAEKTTVTNLTITGQIDASDFKFMQSYLTSLITLDITNVSIVGYSGSDFPPTSFPVHPTYPPNEIPHSSFINNPTLKTIKLPTSIASIGFFAFDNVNQLQTVTIPQGVSIINSDAFSMCDSLKTVRFLSATCPSFGTYSSYAFSKTPSTTNYLAPDIFVPRGCYNTYRSSDYWFLKNTKTNIYEYKLTASTNAVTSITTSTAVFNGNLSLITESPVVSHGFCWNTGVNPTISDSKCDIGSIQTTGLYSSNITNLNAGTKYYVRAYAIDGEVTEYGNEVSFTTGSLPSAAGTISGLQTVCQGQNSVIYTVPTIDYATSYVWTLPSGVTGSSSTNTITVNYLSTFTSGSIIVKGHNVLGDGTPSTLAIIANLLPSDAETITGSTSVCQGESTVIYSTPVINNATSYIWTLPTGATGTSTTNNITISYSKTAISGNLSVKGQNDCGYGNVYSLPITVNQLPVISVTDKTVVSGGSVSLDATTNYTGSGTLSYFWSPETGLNDATIANPTATVTSDITYTIIVTTPNGCSATDSVSIKIIPMSKPQIGIVSVNSSNKNIIVWNKPATIGIESYSIFRETNTSDVYEKIGSVPYSDSSLYVDNSSNPDMKSYKYKISILDKSGQESQLSDPHKTMHLSINKGQNNTYNLIWEPYNGFTPSTYIIYRGTNTSSLSLLDATSGSSTQYSDIIAPSGEVYYQLEVISPTLITPSKGESTLQKTKESESNLLVTYNSSRSNIVTNAVANIVELNASNIVVYPNPVKDVLNIDFVGGSTFEILNLMGQIIYNGNLNVSNIVQTSNLSSGVYLIKFKTAKTFEYKKIIKE